MEIRLKFARSNGPGRKSRRLAHSGYAAKLIPSHGFREADEIEASYLT